MIHDDFTLECAGASFSGALTFERLYHGVSIGSWNRIGIQFIDQQIDFANPLADVIDFPSTIIDYKEKDDGSYEWYIEFVCIDGPDGWGNAFYSFQFYAASYENADTTIAAMENSFRVAGL